MVAWLAGQRVTASKLSVTTLQAAASSALLPTTTETDIPGATLTFTTTRSNVQVTVIAVADIESIGVAADGIVVVRLDLNGFARSEQVLWQGNGDENRSTCAGVWEFTLTQGTHTVKLTGDRSGGADGENRINSVHTTITAIIEDAV